jgi:hypothetical protein
MIFIGYAAVNPPSDELLRRSARRSVGQIVIVNSKPLHPAPGKFPSRLVHILKLFGAMPPLRFVHFGLENVPVLLETVRESVCLGPRT